MQKYFSADIEAIKRCNRAAISRHCDMSHGLSGLVAEARGDQLIVAPHRAIEEHQRRAGKPCFELIGDAGAGGDEIEEFSVSPVLDAKADRVAAAVIAARMSPAFQIPGAFAGDGKGEDFYPRGRAVRQPRLEG